MTDVTVTLSRWANILDMLKWSVARVFAWEFNTPVISVISVII